MITIINCWLSTTFYNYRQHPYMLQLLIGRWLCFGGGKRKLFEYRILVPWLNPLFLWLQSQSLWPQFFCDSINIAIFDSRSLVTLAQVLWLRMLVCYLNDRELSIKQDSIISALGNVQTRVKLSATLYKWISPNLIWCVSQTNCQMADVPSLHSSCLFEYEHYGSWQ